MNDSLEQLAQIMTPDGCVEAFFDRRSRTVVVKYGESTWYRPADSNIVDLLAEVVAVKASVIRLRSLTLFEGRVPHTTVTEATINDMEDFYACEWSDYACDYMAFQCDLEYPLD